MCNVDETLPTRGSNQDFYKACEYASFYASTVTLLPTHREETNKVILQNRRIGVGIIDWTGWIIRDGLFRVIKHMRKGYEIIKTVNRKLAAEAGIPASIKLTTIKPGGSIPKLPGKTPGIGYPTYKHTLRRMRVAANNPICPVLDNANIPWEPDYFDPANTRIYEYPTLQGPAEPADQISLWEQAMNLVTVQREWADNAVSNTLYFKPKWKLIRAETTFIRDWSVGEDKVKKERENQAIDGFAAIIGEALHLSLYSDLKNLKPLEICVDGDYKIVTKLNKYGEWELYIYVYDPNHEEGIIEKVLSAITPLIKSCSLLPHSAKGAYRQMPEEGISVEEYEKRKKAIKPIDWSKFRGSDGVDEKFCQGDTCVIPKSSG